MSSKISVSRQCQFCGKLFLARTTVTKFCSTPCASRGYKVRIKEDKIAQSNHQTILAIGSIDKAKSDSKEILTVNAAAALLNCSRRSIYNMIHSGILRARNFGKRKIRILKSDIFAIFESPQLDFFQPTSKKVKVLESDAQLTKDNCYSIGDLIALFGKTRSDLYTFLKRNEIPKIKIGKEVFWAQASVDALFRKWKQPKKLGLQKEREANDRELKKALERKDCYSIEECVALFNKDRGLVYGLLNRRNVPKLRIGQEVYRSKVAVHKVLRSIKKEEGKCAR